VNYVLCPEEVIDTVSREVDIPFVCGRNEYSVVAGCSALST
jgi:hypothetical protein